ncbi:1-acyl-sn-glycerol-3-phosphate acyltransferase [Mesoplasma syrphidae]|uniref:1-acyl-sn-glycerol-3-phosphate acyltransferase n=1 Tax=Mesoplasma syrphidae TaxID=225999 RepID=A0A2K9BJN3_9MOLU|nr:lysophospholipid acyltransferase family protein [Mesoplasma syrphidae]AUF83486.1 1-acyl-sn-glycerol-3-phosphate acyltransferase [Mesoplasma syrphidae]
MAKQAIKENNLEVKDLEVETATIVETNSELKEEAKLMKPSNESNSTTAVIDDEAGKPKEKANFSKAKMLFMWWPLWRISRKSKKIVKKNRNDPNTYSEEYRYQWVKKAVNKVLFTLNVDIKIEGIENWLDRGVILAPNHQSNIDPAILIAINDFSRQQPLAFIAKEELWDDKNYGAFVRLIDCVPLDRRSPRSALTAFKEAKDLVVDYKRSLVIFPEGTRSGTQEIGEFHAAALKVAQMANAPVVPVTIINSHQVFAEKRPKRVEIKVVFGKPIMPAKHISLKTEDLTKNVRKEVVANMQKWEHEPMRYELKKLSKKDIKALEKDIKQKEESQKNKKKKSFKDLFKIVD